MRKTHSEIFMEAIIQFEPWCQKWKDWHLNGQKPEERPDKNLPKDFEQGMKLIEECPHGLCDGSGSYDEGEFDDLHEVKCLCQIDKEIDHDE
jgi:hypothetical protein